MVEARDETNTPRPGCSSILELLPTLVGLDCVDMLHAIFSLGAKSLVVRGVLKVLWSSDHRAPTSL